MSIQRYIIVLWLIVCVCSSTKANATDLPRKTPEELGLSSRQLDRINSMVEKGIENGDMPGCVVMIGRRQGIAFAKAYGHRQIEPTKEEMTLDTVFDMASITKPVATATSIMLLVERGQIRLGEPVATYIPEFAQNGKAGITIEHLLTHQGGLVPDNPIEDYEHGIDEAWKQIWALKPVEEVGAKFVYTDVGFITLGEVVHRVTGQTVAEFAAENIFQLLGMNETGYLPSDELKARAATTEKIDGTWRRGEVHDPRAYLLGGVAGHAGLFSTAGDLAKYARMQLCNGRVADRQLLNPLTISEMRKPRSIGEQKRALGWDSLSKYSSNRGELFSEHAVGHGGFTGNGFWIDPKLDLFVIFLSTRLHPDGVGNVNPLIGRIGTVAAAAIQNAERAPSSPEPRTAKPPALLGIDVLERDQFAILRGHRVGLITNHTGLNSEGERTIDVLANAEGVDLVVIFSPEHGLQGKLDVSDISDTRDEATGLPVHSLYGETRKPTAKQLEGIDTLVFDIQDIGARFYTYESTMGLALEAAAEHKLKFVVLDRPNPITGELVEGPVMDSGKRSFVAHHTIPVRHGMTVGELAKMFAKENKLEVDLHVVPVENWRRAEYWDATGLVWTNPSPNMRSLAEAVLYPGIGLLETTNVSVGRGTDTPFEVVGAPWIDAVKLAAHLNAAGLAGVTFVPIHFTPGESKFSGDLCHGVNIIVIDRSVFRPVRTGLAMALALRKLHPDGWETDNFNRLLVSDKVFDAVKAGRSLDEIEKLYAEELAKFMERRREFIK